MLRFVLFVENNEYKQRFGLPYFVHKKINTIKINPYFQELGGVTQHMMFYPRQEIFEGIKFSAI